MAVIRYALWIVLVTSVLVIILDRGAGANSVLSGLANFNRQTIAALQGKASA